MTNPGLERLRHHVSGAIARGEAVAIVENLGPARGQFCPLVVPGHGMTLDRLGNAECRMIAAYWYEATRGACAFSIPKHGERAPMGYVAKRGNGAAFWYDFADNSRLTIGRANKGERGRNAITWGPDKMTAYAVRRLWPSGGGMGPLVPETFRGYVEGRDNV